LKLPALDQLHSMTRIAFSFTGYNTYNQLKNDEDGYHTTPTFGTTTISPIVKFDKLLTWDGLSFSIQYAYSSEHRDSSNGFETKHTTYSESDQISGTVSPNFSSVSAAGHYSKNDDYQIPRGPNNLSPIYGSTTSYRDLDCSGILFASSTDSSITFTIFGPQLKYLITWLDASDGTSSPSPHSSLEYFDGNTYVSTDWNSQLVTPQVTLTFLK
jgi:hypothetical protein